jgi:hypothetical protein
VIYIAFIATGMANGAGTGAGCEREHAGTYLGHGHTRLSGSMRYRPLNFTCRCVVNDSI